MRTTLTGSTAYWQQAEGACEEEDEEDEGEEEDSAGVERDGQGQGQPSRRNNNKPPTYGIKAAVSVFKQSVLRMLPCVWQYTVTVLLVRQLSTIHQYHYCRGSEVWSRFRVTSTLSSCRMGSVSMW
eukprot:1397523-Rhodomonas_salina.1